MSLPLSFSLTRRSTMVDVVGVVAHGSWLLKLIDEILIAAMGRRISDASTNPIRSVYIAEEFVFR